MKDVTIQVLKGFDPDICDQLIHEQNRGFNGYHINKRHAVDEGRLKAWSLEPEPFRPDLVPLKTRVEEECHRVIREYSELVPASKYWPARYGLETLRVKSYDPDLGQHFPMHQDAGVPGAATRFLAMLFYLNDSDAGTRFPDQDITVPARRGTVCVFPPFWLYPHEGLRPFEGVKYIASSYMHVA
jgi:prolyl 4-hydroxylase